MPEFMGEQNTQQTERKGDAAPEMEQGIFENESEVGVLRQRGFKNGTSEEDAEQCGEEKEQILGCCSNDSS